MTSIQNTAKSKEPTTDLAWEGLKLGVKIGLIVSTSYALVWTFITIILEFSSPSYEPTDGDTFLLVALIFMIMAWLLAVVPAAIIGAITGMYLGQLATLTRKRISSYFFWFLSVSSCLVLVILFHVLFQIPIVLSSQTESSTYSIDIYGGYPFAIGIPSVIYILTGGWLGWKLYAKSTTQADRQK